MGPSLLRLLPLFAFYTIAPIALVLAMVVVAARSGIDRHEVTALLAISTIALSLSSCSLAFWRTELCAEGEDVVLRQWPRRVRRCRLRAVERVVVTRRAYAAFVDEAGATLLFFRCTCWRFRDLAAWAHAAGLSIEERRR